MKYRDYLKASKLVKPHLWASKLQIMPNGCHEWLASLTSSGYPRFSIERESFYAHRLAYCMKHGDDPTDLVIDHLCRNRRCVNPDHLEAVSMAENVRRGLNGPTMKTHCKWGHPLADATPRKDHPGGRRCRTCERERGRRRRSERLRR